MTAIFVITALIVIVLMCFALYQEEDPNLEDTPLPNRVNDLQNRPSVTKSPSLQTATPAQKKAAADTCMDELIDIIDRARIVVGSRANFIERQYQGATLELGEQIHSQLKQAANVSAEMTSRLDPTTQAAHAASLGRIEQLYPNSSTDQSPNLTSMPWKKLLSHHRGLNHSIREDLKQFEQAWESISQQLDKLDDRHRDILLEQIKLSESPSFNNHLEWNQLKTRWSPEIGSLKDQAFSTSRHDPVTVKETHIPELNNQLSTIESILSTSKQVRSQHFQNFVDISSQLSEKEITTDWLTHEISLLEATLDYRSPKSADQLDSTMQKLVDKLHHIEASTQHLKELNTTATDTLPQLIESTRESIAAATGRDQAQVLDGESNIDNLLKSVESSIIEFEQAIESGSVELIELSHIQTLQRIDELKSIIEKVKEAAIDGHSKIDNIRESFSQFKKSKGEQMQAVAEQLDHINPEIVHPTLAEQLRKIQPLLTSVSQQIQSSHKYLDQGQYLRAVSSLTAAENDIHSLEDLADSVERLRRELEQLDAQNESDFKQLSDRINSAGTRMVGRFVSEDTRVHKKLVSDLFLQLQTSSEASAHQLRDPRALSVEIQKITEHLNSLEASMLMDQGLYELLHTKVVNIESVLEKAQSMIHTSQVDGIPDSPHTKELITAVAQKEIDWQNFKPKLTQAGANWSALSHELDLFLQTCEVIAISFDAELAQAAQASDALKNASYQLRELADWRGGHGNRIDLTEPSTTLHKGYIALSSGNYPKSIQLAMQTETEMRDQRHLAKNKDTKAQVREASLESRKLGTPNSQKAEQAPIDAFSNPEKSDMDNDSQPHTVNDLPRNGQLTNH